MKVIELSITYMPALLPYDSPVFDSERTLQHHLKSYRNLLNLCQIKMFAAKNFDVTYDMR